MIASSAVAQASSREPAAPLRLPKAAELVAARLRSQIVRGELREGEALPPEPQMLKMLGVGRPALREALRILESEGLVRVRRGSRGGATVHLPDRSVAAQATGLLLQSMGATLHDVYETRMVLEPAAARRLAEKGTRAAHADLRRAWDAERALLDRPAEWTHAAVQFHERMLALSGLKTLSILAGLLTHITERHQSQVVSQADRQTIADQMPRASKAHGRFVELVQARDGEGAESYWRAHLEAAGAAVLKGHGARSVVDVLD